MPRLSILAYPHPGLRQTAVEVTEFGAELHTLIDSLFETMYAHNGIGLAAPQAGKLYRVFVIDLGGQPGFEQQKYEFVNPRLRSADGKIRFEEACLSVPGIAEYVDRKNSVTVDFQDRHGNHHTLTAEGLFSVAIQHENDHLDGMLFIDRLSTIKRLLMKRKLPRQVPM